MVLQGFELSGKRACHSSTPDDVAQGGERVTPKALSKKLTRPHWLVIASSADPKYASWSSETHGARRHELRQALLINRPCQGRVLPVRWGSSLDDVDKL